MKKNVPEDNALTNFTKIEPNMLYFITEHVRVNLNAFRLIPGDHDIVVHWSGAPFKIRINSHIYRSYWYWEVFINLGRLGWKACIYFVHINFILINSRTISELVSCILHIRSACAICMITWNFSKAKIWMGDISYPSKIDSKCIVEYSLFLDLILYCPIVILFCT